jgi:predicted DNA-binding transcriptional regulator AlpA
MKPQAQVAITRTIRRHELREIVPLADTTIYDMEQRGEFPQRFYLTSRCVVWDLGRSRSLAGGTAPRLTRQGRKARAHS